MPNKVATGVQGATLQTGFHADNSSQLIAAIFDAEMLGIAIFDNQHRFLAVNETLASLHGIPAQDHVGRTLREVFPQASPRAESLIDQVFHTGESIPSAEITAQVPTRNEMGHWLVNFVPIKNENNQVSGVSSIAIEATQQIMLARCLRSLMDSLPQVRDQVSWAYLSSQKQAVVPTLLAQSAEKLEECVRAMQALSGLVEAITSSSGGKDEEDNRQASFPYVVPSTISRNGRIALTKAPTIACELSPREVQVVTLLAAGKANKEISSILRITVKTAETYRARIMSKL
ncbi:MAG: hypothetical protein DMG78_31520, partial [Acidobacteria bacterium]